MPLPAPSAISPRARCGRTAIGLGVAETFGVAHQQRVLAPGLRLSPQHLGDGACQACSTAPLKNRRTALRSGLAGGSSRDLLDDRDVGGNLVARQPRSQVVHERRDLDGLAQFHHGDRCLAEAVIGAADDRRAVHRRVALQRGAHIVGHHLEPAADDRLIGAPQDPQESVRVDARHVGGAHPVRGRSQLAGFDLQKPGLVRAQRGAVVVDDPQLRPEAGPAHAAALDVPVLLIVGQRPAGDTATEFRCGVRRQDRYAELLGERVGVLGGQWRGARCDGADALQIVSSQIGVQHGA